MDFCRFEASLVTHPVPGYPGLCRERAGEGRGGKVGEGRGGRREIEEEESRAEKKKPGEATESGLLTKIFNEAISWSQSHSDHR